MSCPAQGANRLHEAAAAVVATQLGGDTAEFPPGGVPRRVSFHQRDRKGDVGRGRGRPPAGFGSDSPIGLRQPYALTGVAPPGPDPARPTDGGADERHDGRIDEPARRDERFRDALACLASPAATSWRSKAAPSRSPSWTSWAMASPSSTSKPSTRRETPRPLRSDPTPASKLLLAYDGTSSGGGLPVRPARCDVFERCTASGPTCELHASPPSGYDGLGLQAHHEPRRPRRCRRRSGESPGRGARVVGALNGYGLAAFSVDLLARARPQPGERIREARRRLLGHAEYTPDCREFYSATGQINYRVFSDTVSCTSECHPYRLDNAKAADCLASGGFTTQCRLASGANINSADCRNKGGLAYNGLCYNLAQAVCENTTSGFGGVWTDYISNSQCIYLGSPAESVACTAPGCREYKGDFSGVSLPYFEDSFEFDAGGWENGVLAGEAYSVGGHSFASNGSAVRKNIETLGLAKGKMYTVSLWAKSSNSAANALRVALSPDNSFDGGDHATATQNLNTNWRYYRFGPILVDWDNANNFIFLVGDNKIYVDNIRLEQITDQTYLITNSWQTPASCDQNNSGAAAPQYMLGCDAYKNANSQTQYLKSFYRLCNQSAIGCEAMIDTQNSTSPNQEIYNDICYLPGDAACSTPEGCDCLVDLTTDLGKVTACKVVNGDKYCRYKSDFNSPNYDKAILAITGDYAFVPKDKFVYLVNRPEYTCQASDKGCIAVAKPRISKEVNFPPKDYLKEDGGEENIFYFKNDPEKYLAQQVLALARPALYARPTLGLANNMMVAVI